VGRDEELPVVQPSDDVSGRSVAKDCVDALENVIENKNLGLASVHTCLSYGYEKKERKEVEVGFAQYVLWRGLLTIHETYDYIERAVVRSCLEANLVNELRAARDRGERLRDVNACVVKDVLNLGMHARCARAPSALSLESGCLFGGFQLKRRIETPTVRTVDFLSKERLAEPSCLARAESTQEDRLSQPSECFRPVRDLSERESGRGRKFPPTSFQHFSKAWELLFCSLGSPRCLKPLSIR
jgi:hypothetical protein